MPLLVAGLPTSPESEVELAPLLGTLNGVKLSFPRTKYGAGAEVH
jgi:hypothetical protein